MNKRQDTSGRVLNDLLFIFNLGFVAIIVLLMLIIADPKEKEQDSKAQGNVTVQISWPDRQECDVDLWVQAPYKNGYDQPVGYSNKSSVVFNLLRDDLGGWGDLVSSNQEIAYSKGIPDGEYTVNLHLFGAREGIDKEKSDLSLDHRRWSSEDCQLPVPVEVEVGYKGHAEGHYSPIAADIVELVFPGQEKTAVRWKMKNNKPVIGSIHSTQKDIRSLSVFESRP